MGSRGKRMVAMVQAMRAAAEESDSEPYSSDSLMDPTYESEAEEGYSSDDTTPTKNPPRCDANSLTVASQSKPVKIIKTKNRPNQIFGGNHQERGLEISISGDPDIPANIPDEQQELDFELDPIINFPSQHNPESSDIEEPNVNNQEHEPSPTIDSPNQHNTDVNEERPNVDWKDPEGNHMTFNFNEVVGVKPELAAVLVGSSPMEFYSLFLDSEILNLMVDETNLYVTQLLLSEQDIPGSSRLRAWEPTNVNEMKKFVGILGYMGIVKLPSIRHYWSTKKLYQFVPLSEVMSRNRFELLLKVWHFSDNENCPEGDRGYKLEALIRHLLNKFQDAYTPGKEFCIDETLVPFRGRLKFKQYIPQKAHKYGVKFFKLCCSNGYTWNMKMYSGKERDAKCTVPTKIVMELSEKLLDKGRTVVTDNFYTSMELAHKLLKRQTHLLGTLRSNRKYNPTEVANKKLKVGEIIGKENANGISVIKWKDKRDVMMLSTKHSTETVTVNHRTGPVQKPVAIVEYNTAKSSIDLSDQMSSYNSALRKTVKWYRKMATELLLGTSIVNAHFLYKDVNESSMSITEFREEIVHNLLFPPEEKENEMAGPSKKRKLNTHQFRKKEGPSHSVRKYCHGCYQKKIKGLIPKSKVTKVTTYCNECDGSPHYCLDCFSTHHN